MLVTANIFQPLIDVFEAVLKFFHNNVGISWGFSIVLLTIVVRAAMIPLTLKQIKSMVRLQALSPQMKEVQAKYKEDKQRQQQEIMKLYKEQGVNPFGSCLPLVAQLPVFVSLYYMLRQSLRLDICPGVQKAFQAHFAAVHNVSAAEASSHTVVCGGHGASFLFIHDLTDKATGATLIALLILYVGTQLASTIMMSGSQTDPNMRRVMMFMPLVFVLVVIRFPAGVLVYWITTNTWTIGQQYVVKRRMGPLQAATAGAAASTGGAAGPPGGALPSSSESSKTSKPTAGRAREKVPAPKSGTAKSGTAKSGTAKSGTAKSGTAKSAAAAGNGSATGGLGALIRSKVKPEDKSTPVATAQRDGPPPKPPRKKKKRSGRRR
jgi:YidC/Oxa1 family membrane protein insertase